MAVRGIDTLPLSIACWSSSRRTVRCCFYACFVVVGCGLSDWVDDLFKIVVFREGDWICGCSCDASCFDFCSVCIFLSVSFSLCLFSILVLHWQMRLWRKLILVVLCFHKLSLFLFVRLSLFFFLTPYGFWSLFYSSSFFPVFFSPSLVCRNEVVLRVGRPQSWLCSRLLSLLPGRYPSKIVSSFFFINSTARPCSVVPPTTSRSPSSPL
jgi:hypothetical protein